MQKIRLLGLFVLLMISTCSNSKECVDVRSNGAFPERTKFETKSVATYCVEEDIKLKEDSEFDWHSGTMRYKAPIVISVHSDSELDLRQHTLIGQSSKAKRPLGIIAGVNTLIKNGTLRVIGKQGVGAIHNASGVPYIKVLDEKKEVMSCRLNYPDCEEVSYLNSIDKLPPKYQDAHITIDNMHIFATYRGVQLADNHNTIRNSTIEVDDNTAIYLMGQYPIIENNTIIIHSNKNGDTETQKQYNIQIKDGAIKLRDAKGGIIRNNRIIYKGGFLGFGKAPVAINLLDSKDVLIEGNTIEGFDKLVRENGGTSFTESNNTIK